MPDTQLHFSNDCPNCHGVGYLALSYPDDPNFNPAASPICTWCNTGSNKAAPKWQGGLLSMSTTPTSIGSSALNSPCYPLQGNRHEGWNTSLPLGRSPAILPYPSAIDGPHRSFPSSPGSATDLSPSNYSEAKGYFDFIPIQSAQYDRSVGQTHSAPISPGELSVPGSDNDLVNANEYSPLSPMGGCSRTQNQRDSKARCLKKLDGAMEKLIGLLPPEMQLSCKRGRANGLKLVEDYIIRIITENDKVRGEAKKATGEKDRVVSENQQLREEIAQLRLALQNQYR